MEKKIYATPETKVVELENEALLTDTSNPGGSMSGGSDEAKRRTNNNWDDEEEYYENF